MKWIIIASLLIGYITATNRLMVLATKHASNLTDIYSLSRSTPAQTLHQAEQIGLALTHRPSGQ